ncbi:Wzz/FepE/Etk N-terminal domain-containing protein [Tissierella pigra]|uniref:Exopolysaccharide biosynthesis protein n=1 Tax=Tissierella pigra TaxID=2607614 RepID=A0A6N7XDW6_9FIRM|nr:Wzz/FepE/Etk N-terminal domain-containing protein [Tissierella pigra]MSU00251.1 exopolysaccharide biosynthesis protein [Tissierella pigra]
MEERNDIEEISLRELIETLLKGKRLIALIVAVTLVLSFGVSFYMKENSQRAKIIISLNFKGIESGLNPDGTKFDIQKIKSPTVLMPVIETLELNEEVTTDSIRRNINITPIVPNHIVTYIQKQREEGQDYTYFPNEFVVTLDVDKSKGITTQNVTEILDSIIDSYGDYFNDNYSEEAVLANAIGTIDYSSYDYPETSRVINNQISIMKSYLNTRIGEAPEFRSTRTGMTFADISKSLDIIDSVELNRMDSLIGAFNLTKNMEKLIINYEYRIKRDELEKNKKQSELSVAKGMMESYKRETNALLIPGMSTEGLEIDNSEKYYDKLVEKATNAGVDASNKSHDINYYLNEIEKLKNDDVDIEIKQRAEKDVLELADIIKVKLIEWIDIINETASEYYEIKFSKAIMKISPVEIYNDVNMKLNVAIAGVLGLMLGIFVVFFREYWKNTNPNNTNPKTVKSTK